MLWRLCPLETGIPERPTLDPGTEPGSTQITADAGEFVADGESTLTGNVEVLRDEYAVQADRITYDEPESVVRFWGEAARLWTPSLFWEGGHGMLALEREFARLDAGRYHLLGRRGHGRAAKLAADRVKDATRLEEVDYTTCPVGDPPAWRLAASSIRLDHTREWGRAENVVLKIRDVPVFYLPRLSFPISDKRKTGLLTPSFGTSSNSGLDIRVPFYWNIHPQLDATIAPRLLGDRGGMLESEVRYLYEHGEGELDTEFLPSDDLRDDDARGAVQYTHYQHIPRLRTWGTILYNYVSDDEYLEDFGGSLASTSTRFLERRADFTHRSRWLYARARLQSYQTLDDAISGGTGPYKRLPQVFLRAQSPWRMRHLRLWLEAETSYFDRDDSVVGGRIDLRPRLSFPFWTPGAYLRPEIELRHTQYFLDELADPLSEENPARTVPVVSIDSGLILEREFEVAGGSLLSTIEPRVFYVYIPEVEQDEFPDFDTGRYDFSFRQLFREDRFAGGDRVGDTHQLSIGVTTDLLDTRTGQERLRAGIGQIIYFADRDVTLRPGDAPETDSVSELVAEMNARLTPSLSVAASLQWDPELDEDQTRKGALRIRYQPAEAALINLAYRIRHARTDIEQTDLSFRWPLGERWSVLGRWNYSLEESETLEVVGGVEYNSCCWGVRAAARRFLRNVDALAAGADRQFDTGIFLQVELKGLAGLGRSTASFLRRTIPGYELEF